MHEEGVWALEMDEDFQTIYSGGRDRKVYATELNQCMYCTSIYMYTFGLYAEYNCTCIFVNETGIYMYMYMYMVHMYCMYHIRT